MNDSDRAMPGGGSRRTMAVSSAILVASVIVAALLPAAPDGVVGGPIGAFVAVVAGTAMVTVWVAALWHASTVRPWTASVARWLVIVLLVFGTGIAGILYYLFYARSYRPSLQNSA